jgi:hypothetical protein
MVARTQHVPCILTLRHVLTSPGRRARALPSSSSSLLTLSSTPPPPLLYILVSEQKYSHLRQRVYHKSGHVRRAVIPEFARGEFDYLPRHRVQKWAEAG